MGTTTLQKSVGILADSNSLGQDNIYHYCGVDSFFHIVNSQSMFLSSTRYMNDKADFRWVRHLLTEKMLSQHSISTDPKRLTHLNSLLEDDIRLSGGEAFIACFSLQGDLLSQWSRYADNNKGVSIGFNVNVLHNVLKGFNTYNREAVVSGRGIPLSAVSRFQMKPVIYGIEEQYRNLSLDRPYHSTNGPVTALCDTADHLVWQSTYLKSPTFSEESEVRIAYMPEINVTDRIEIKGGNDKLKYRTSNGKLIPFFLLKLGSQAISSVTLGAECKLTELEVHRFLVSVGINLDRSKITRTDSTYTNA
ncbi:DUF2971 domain-containing protein [Vibrio profundum]|uniref:DUF2971 domain-containing protein n=1 Tax=Vibrio profundum TaxID=2910247 RepID=UPI003D12958A